MSLPSCSPSEQPAKKRTFNGNSKLRDGQRWIAQVVLRLDRVGGNCRRDIVKCCVSERGASLLNDWLGGLLGLFFAIDELNADDDLGDEFKALESTPMLLGLQGEFKDHRQGRDP